MRTTRFLFILLFLNAGFIQSQPVTRFSSSEIYLNLQKLKVLGSVLYIAAHPDDENTRLLAYLSKEKLLRTGYLSITRGDGGQNLIGNEQGVSLGLIRTQELLAARRIDGAEQFFTSAYDFGFSKGPDETFRIWNKEKILGEMVLVIRKFRPDVIIARFPGDERAGHGHHTASGLLAKEAFEAAADPTKYPGQLTSGISVWKAKRVLWNTFNFGNTNTIKPGQFQLDVGAFNPFIGQSMGEIAAYSRSEHKSQGFGVPSSRGEAFEFFETLGGDKPGQLLTDGIDLTWARAGDLRIEKKIDSIIETYRFDNPSASVPALMLLLQTLVDKTGAEENNSTEGKQNIYLYYEKIAAINRLIRDCMGIHFEASAGDQFAVSGDSVTISFSFINRGKLTVQRPSVTYNDSTFVLADSAKFNLPVSTTIRFAHDVHPMSDQPYWLRDKMSEGSYTVSNQNLIGLPTNPAYNVRLRFVINDQLFTYFYPLQYKFTDPVKGEIRQPVITVPAVVISLQPSVVLTNVFPRVKPVVSVRYQSLKEWGLRNGTVEFSSESRTLGSVKASLDLTKNRVGYINFPLDSVIGKNKISELAATLKIPEGNEELAFSNFMRIINYDHIPTIHYMYQSKVKLVNEEVKTVGKRIGYIQGAGDNVTEALEAMGYEVILLNENDLTAQRLAGMDAVITGVRAYNVHEYLSGKYELLMDYVHKGGNLIVQYNTNSNFGPLRGKISPYPLTISRQRVTDENSPVRFLIPAHRVLNFPNKITQKDFEGWTQERGIYFADPIDSKYQQPLAMNDPNEAEQKGSLIIADYGKGKFVYTGLAFFRQLPAAVPGAYRLLANIIALNKNNPGFQ